MTYQYQSLYEQRARELLSLAASGHAQSVQHILAISRLDATPEELGRALADEDDARKL